MSDNVIPTHNQHIDEIRVIKLASRSSYDTSIPHRHNYIELFIFKDSGGSHQIDFVDFSVKANSIHLVSAGRVHHLRRGLETHGYVMLFDPSVFGNSSVVGDFLFEMSCYDVSENCPIFEFSAKQGDLILNLAETIWQDYNSDSRLKQHFVLSNLTLLLLHCLQTLNLSEKKLTRDQQLYARFRKSLRQNFKTMKKVQEYVQLLGTTSRKLNEIVSHKTGFSVSQLIYRQLILEAKRLLNTGKSSKEVAHILNFDDPAHFSKFFKKQTGVPPSEFIKIHD